ncbi:MAG: hypothetical protein K2I74_04655 [Treponemataceae bacterium]|nr:hypothetical protein [Treponemataceae bacterium]
MKKSIRIAAALCAAVFALPVLAGCDFINGDKSKDGDNSTVSGNGGAGENPFKGKTIERDWTHQDRLHYCESWKFTTDTDGLYVMDCRAIDTVSRDGPIYYEVPFTYSLGSANGKNFLRVLLGVLNDEETEHFLQEYAGVSEKTKELLVERELTEFLYYEFGQNDTVKINDRYYAGDIAKSRESFENVYDNTAVEYVEISFRRKSLRLQWYKDEPDESDDTNAETGGTASGEGNVSTDTESDDEVTEFSNSYGRTVTEKRYWGIPEFKGNDFTVEMYSVAGREDECTYTPVGTLKGNYDIPGMTTTSKCTGKVYFTEFPNEMKGVFATSYSVQNWNPKYDNKERNDWEEYKIVTE